MLQLQHRKKPIHFQMLPTGQTFIGKPEQTDHWSLSSLVDFKISFRTPLQIVKYIFYWSIKINAWFPVSNSLLKLNCMLWGDVLHFLLYWEAIPEAELFLPSNIQIHTNSSVKPVLGTKLLEERTYINATPDLQEKVETRSHPSGDIAAFFTTLEVNHPWYLKMWQQVDRRRCWLWVSFSSGVDLQGPHKAKSSLPTVVLWPVLGVGIAMS